MDDYNARIKRRNQRILTELGKLRDKHQDWSVWFGTTSSQYCAHPASGAAQDILKAETPEGLSAAIHDAEQSRDR